MLDGRAQTNKRTNKAGKGEFVATPSLGELGTPEDMCPGSQRINPVRAQTGSRKTAQYLHSCQ